MYRIKIQSCETPEEAYEFRGVTTTEAVLACIKGLTSHGDMIDETFGELLETLGVALKDGEAKSFDFSAPECACTIEVDVVEDDEPLPQIVKTIADVDYAKTYGLIRLTATYSDGSTGHLFDYFEDEIGFLKAELIGLTENEAVEAFHAKTQQYLRS